MNSVSSHNLQLGDARAVWPGLALDNSYARLPKVMYSPAEPEPLAEPELLWFNAPLASVLGLGGQPQELITAFASGHRVPFGARPIRRKVAQRPWGAPEPRHGATAEIALGEHIDRCFQRCDLSLQQHEDSDHDLAGAELSVRNGLHQLLMGEVLNAMGVQAPRVLAIAYDDAGGKLDQARASVIKTGESPLTIGAFEYAFSQLGLAELERLTDYAIARIDPALINSDTPYTAFFERVCDKLAVTMAQWASVGFIHSKLDTHLTAIDGGMSLTPYSGFMDNSDIDRIRHPSDATGRYAFSAQPIAAHWNLCRFANVLRPLTGPEGKGSGSRIQGRLDGFFNRYEQHRIGYLQRPAVEPTRGTPRSRTLSATVEEVVEGDWSSIDRFLTAYGGHALAGDRDPICKPY
ncbi:protein adenylyltransferase SelO family protein [Salicola sp. Rm-C-2C1-2]|uniref:protein adenylyltransferase SelO family protein n=1 Tax=Salicola sp. Rm-C-2C1-2 TaxID=3141321 RepID=UPI0032E46281